MYEVLKQQKFSHTRFSCREKACVAYVLTSKESMRRLQIRQDAKSRARFLATERQFQNLCQAHVRNLPAPVHRLDDYISYLAGPLLEYIDDNDL